MPRRSLNMQEQFAAARSDYSVAQPSRFRRDRRGVDWQGSNADYHVRDEMSYWKQVETYRDMERHDVVLSAGVDRLVDNVVQGGMVLDPQTGSKRLNDENWYRWQRFAEDPEQCDVAGELRWHDIECLSLRRTVFDGDHLVVGTKLGPLQVFEGHRNRTPAGKQKAVANVFLGIERDDVGRKLAAWVTKNDVAVTRSLRQLYEFQRIPFVRDRETGLKQVFQIMFPTRPGQARGFSLLNPIVDVAGMHDDIQFATLVKQQIASCWAILRTQSESALPGTDAALGSRSTERLADGMVRLLEGIGPGMDILLRPGEEAQGFAPQIPANEFFKHAHLLLTFLAINLKIPVCVLLLDPSNTNFSGWRGAIDEARKGFMQLQRRHIAVLHSPVYRFQVDRWYRTDLKYRTLVDQERAKYSGDQPFDPAGHQWNPPRWKYIEPLKDATAELLRRANSLDAPRVICAERGTEWETHVDHTIEDNAYAIRKAKLAALELNRDPDLQDDDPVHWRELYPSGAADGFKIVLGGGETSQSDVTTAPPNNPAA